MPLKGLSKAFTKGLYKAFKRPFEGKREQWQQARSLKGLSNAF